jgi:hypothetical protein
MTPPPLNPPRLGNQINAETSYVKRSSATTQAARWNSALAGDPVFGPTCGLVVGVSPVKDHDGRYPLVWVAAPIWWSGQ